MSAAERLLLEKNPFVGGAGGATIGRPLRAALDEVIRHIALETPIVVVVGSVGTGKTLLMTLAARAWTDLGLSVRQFDGRHLGRMALGERSDLLLIDEGDSITDSMLRALVSAGGKTAATTVVIFCLPSSARRFTSAPGGAVIVELTPLTRSDARSYIQELGRRVRQPDLFTSEALELVVEGSRGLPRLLLSIASLAFFSAAFDGASQIGAKHARLFLKGRSPTHRSLPRRPLTVQRPRAARADPWPVSSPARIRNTTTDDTR